MRYGIRASTTTFFGLMIAALCAASCSRPPASPPPKGPPPRVLLVSDGLFTLRATAYLELHTWLATAARSDAEVPPEYDEAKRAYALVLRDDEDDTQLARTTRALASCLDDRCAGAAVGESFGPLYERALPDFVARAWQARAGAAWVGISAARGALSARTTEVTALWSRLLEDLDVQRPSASIPVDVVSESPPAGRDALGPVALGVRGPCFVRDRGRRSARVNDARLLSCLFVHALLALPNHAEGGPLHDALVRELGPRDGARAWSLLVIHAVSAIVSKWEPKHVSVHFRSARALEEPMLAWLAREWRGRAERSEAFDSRYIERWRARRPPTSQDPSSNEQRDLPSDPSPGNRGS